jgi:hypothetical protein
MLTLLYTLYANSIVLCYSKQVYLQCCVMQRMHAIRHLEHRCVTCCADDFHNDVHSHRVDYNVHLI